MPVYKLASPLLTLYPTYIGLLILPLLRVSVVYFKHFSRLMIFISNGNGFCATRYCIYNGVEKVVSDKSKMIEQEQCTLCQCTLKLDFIS